MANAAAQGTVTSLCAVSDEMERHDFRHRKHKHVMLDVLPLSAPLGSKEEEAVIGDAQ
jgi:hypothetical protein